MSDSSTSVQTPLDAADSISAATGMPAAAHTMTDNDKRSFWQRYRMPIILGIIALSLYVGSIVWMVYGRGQVG